MMILLFRYSCVVTLVIQIFSYSALRREIDSFDVGVIVPAERAFRWPTVRDCWYSSHVDNFNSGALENVEARDEQSILSVQLPLANDSSAS